MIQIYVSWNVTMTGVLSGPTPDTELSNDFSIVDNLGKVMGLAFF